MQDADDEALSKIMGDMDDMESKRVYGKPEDASKGVSITISVMPNGQEEFKDGDHDPAMCGGGCAYHKGGVVEAPTTEDDFQLPPFMRKKAKGAI
jgi:hypothetical protein